MSQIDVLPGQSPQMAADRLKPGDTLFFTPGLHYGRVSIPVDDIYVIGENAILDGSVPLSDKWALATDSDGITSLEGTNTYRVSNPNQVWMLLDGKSDLIFRIDSDYVGVKQTSGYYYMTAYGALAVPNNARPGPDYGADWWNGMEAMSVYNRNNGYIYLKYRDGRRPEGNYRWSGGIYDHRDPPRQDGSVLWLWGRKNISIHGLTIRGCVDGVAIYDSQGIRVEECELNAFDYATRVFGDCNDIKIKRNKIDQRDYGLNIVPPLGKISSEDPYPDARLTSYHQYMMRKFYKDESDSTHGSACTIANGWDDNTQTVYRPKNVEFSYNHVFNCVFGVDCFGGDGIDIGFNHVHNMVDMPFQRSPQGGRNIKLHDNETYEAGYCLIRWHLSNEESGDNYIYNNRVGNLAGVCDVVFHGGTYDGVERDSNLRVWHYHNSYSGCHEIWLIAGIKAFPGFFAINNLISGGAAALDHGGAVVGEYANNWEGTIWPTDQIEHDFIVPDGHHCKGNAIDISQPFILNGRQYDALPGFEQGYAKDIGWNARSDNPEPPNGGEEVTLTAHPTQVKPGEAVSVDFTGGADSHDWIGLYLQDEADQENYLDWLYLNDTQTPVGVTPSGTCTFNMPADEGIFEFRMFAGESYDVSAKSNAVTVSEEEVPPEPETPERIFALLPVWIEGGEIFPITDESGLPQALKMRATPQPAVASTEKTKDSKKKNSKDKKKKK